jgi:hypothetical protein
MTLGSISYGVWLTGIGLQVLLAIVLLINRAWRKYPFFCAYSLFNLFEAAATYAVFGNKLLYFYTYWSCEAVGIVLGLGVVREIFTNVFSPHLALRKLTTIIFRSAIVGLIMLAVVVIYLQSGNARGIVKGVLLAAEAARIVEVGLIMFLFLASGAFGLHWRQNVFGMALGLGMFAAVELITVTMIGYVSPLIRQSFALAHSISFATSHLIWLGYFLAPERIANSVEIPKRAQLEQWNQAVMELINR